MSKTKVRLSVTGWFHGPSIVHQVYTEPKPIAPKDITEQEFYWWINPVYLDPLTQSEIREKFEESSEISLPDFLITEKYQEMCAALTWYVFIPTFLQTTVKIFISYSYMYNIGTLKR